jgi:hypothetical protein
VDEMIALGTDMIQMNIDFVKNYMLLILSVEVDNKRNYFVVEMKVYEVHCQMVN